MKGAPKAFAVRMLAIDALWKAASPSANANAKHLFFTVASFMNPVRLSAAQRASNLPGPTFRRCCSTLKEMCSPVNEPLIETFRGSFGYEHYIILSQRGQEFLRELESALSAEE